MCHHILEKSSCSWKLKTSGILQIYNHADSFSVRKASLDFLSHKVTQQCFIQDLSLLNYVTYMLPIQTGQSALNGIFTFSDCRDLTYLLRIFSEIDSISSIHPHGWCMLSKVTSQPGWPECYHQKGRHHTCRCPVYILPFPLLLLSSHLFWLGCYCFNLLSGLVPRVF